MEVWEINEAMNDAGRLQEIVRQFQDFAKKGNSKNFEGGYNFDDVPFVYTHLRSVVFSQQENNPELYNLSNFETVENFILDKIFKDGKFLRVKNFILFPEK